MHTDYERTKLLQLSLQLIVESPFLSCSEDHLSNPQIEHPHSYMYFTNNTTAPTQYTIILFLLKHITEPLNKIIIVNNISMIVCPCMTISSEKKKCHQEELANRLS